MKLFIAYLTLFLLLLTPNTVLAKKKRPPIKLQSIEEAATKPQKIREYQGWVLVYLDASSPAPSIDVIRLQVKIEEASSLPSGKKVRPCLTCRETNISLKQLSPGYYVFPLPSGVYQITSFNVPYFGLPYIQDTDKDRRFRFRVRGGAINYIGHIEMQKERTSNDADIAYLDRYATAYDELESIVNQLNFGQLFFHGYGTETLFQMETLEGSR